MFARVLRSSLFCALAVTVLAAVGCDNDKVGKTVAVKGKALIDGKPLSFGTVNFVPDESKNNKAAVSVTGTVKDGEYTLQTSSATGGRPGCPPGWYKVTLQPSAPMGDSKGGATPKLEPIAPRYTNPAQSPFQIEVKEGNPPTAYDLDAKSK